MEKEDYVALKALTRSIRDSEPVIAKLLRAAARDKHPSRELLDLVDALAHSLRGSSGLASGTRGQLNSSHKNWMREAPVLPEADGGEL